MKWTVVRLAALARRTREAQKRYFRDRTPDALQESKRLERELDAATEEVLNPEPPSLFDKEN